jgi:hypothetical protein
MLSELRLLLSSPLELQGAVCSVPSFGLPVCSFCTHAFCCFFFFLRMLSVRFKKSPCADLFSVYPFSVQYNKVIQKQTPWLTVHKWTILTVWPLWPMKLVLTFARKECCMAWSMQWITTAVNVGFLDWRCYYFFQVAPQLSSWGWVNPVPDPLLLRKTGSTGNWTQNPWT